MTFTLIVFFELSLVLELLNDSRSSRHAHVWIVLVSTLALLGVFTFDHIRLQKLQKLSLGLT